VLDVKRSAAKRSYTMLEKEKLGSRCSSCGLCVGDCPAARFSDDFNPRQIVIKAFRGLHGSLIDKDSPIWKCTTCYTCQERCPSGVKPVDVIIELRNSCFKLGRASEQVPRIYEMVRRTGMAGILTDTVIRRREDLGLPPFQKANEAEQG
jgi:heterodisulfide reductase subunit C